jgi:glutathione S-transferase
VADVRRLRRGPYAGQSVHFRNYALEKLANAINRYAFEAQRHFKILDDRLAKRKYMLGDTYTVVDMAVWGWARLVPNVLGENAWSCDGAMPASISFRPKYLERALDYIAQHDGVWLTTSDEIAAYYAQNHGLMDAELTEPRSTGHTWAQVPGRSYVFP